MSFRRMSDEVPGSECRSSGEDTPVAWVPDSCTLPTEQRPVREAEFDALFAGAVRATWRPEPTRLRLVLDPKWENVARRLAERESQCCSFFTFAFDSDDGMSYMDIAVPANQEPVLAAMAQQATRASRRP